jgi:hypothetical protein
MGFDGPGDQIQVFAQGPVSGVFVFAGEPTVSGDVGVENGG